MQREVMEYDVVIVGAGPAGLAAAIRLKQLCQQHDSQLTVCLLEKGAHVGAHILSGAVIEPRALNELIPDWKEKGAPLKTPVTQDTFTYLTSKKAFKLPTPPQMHNKENYIINLGSLCLFLAEQAEQLGVEIYSGFAASEVLYDEKGHVQGVVTGDMGIAKDGSHTANYQRGMALHAKQTLFAEGCRGSLTQMLFDRFHLRDDAQPQTYGIGIKELWEISPKHHQEGTVIHTIGWPLDRKTYGGSFIYHLENNRLAVGFIVGLDYQNPSLDPFEEMQRFKLHPAHKMLFENGERVCYGARALNEGGFQAIPRLNFPGGLIIGDGAGFLNVPKIKGIHTTMKSAMVAADAVFDVLTQKAEKRNYQKRLQQSWLWDELYRARNIRPAFQWGLWPGLAYAAFDTYILRGRAPWTLKTHADHTCLKKTDECQALSYPKPDGKITFDKPSSIYLSNTYHNENQPCHLTLKDPQVPITINFNFYDAPEQRYCPAEVYKIVYNKNKERSLEISAQNCIHCKTCDIKDPKQNITWITPEGGGGPNYVDM